MSTRATLCPIIEGVQFTFRNRGREVRVLVLADALQSVFGAPATPEGWLEAYRIHHRAITEAAADRHRAEPPDLVVLRAIDFDLEPPAPVPRDAQPAAELARAR